jgi:hypothetical protein
MEVPENRPFAVSIESRIHPGHDSIAVVLVLLCTDRISICTFVACMHGP